MRNSFRHWMAALAAVAFSSVVAVAVAQNAPPANQNRNAGAVQNAPNPNQGRGPNADDSPGGPAPAHDLNGTWRGPGEPQLNNRIPPMTPKGQARLKLNIPDPFSATSNDPWKTCDPFGMPRIANNEIAEIGFAQMPDRIIILENYESVWREVWMDGRQPPKNIGKEGGPSPMLRGYSVGHWEGDNTLVVNTVGMDEKTWVDRRGYPHTVDAKVEERYTRPDHNHLNFTESVDDPGYYTKPFLLAKAAYRWIANQDDPKVAVIPFSDEYPCVPSEAIEYMKLLGNPADEDGAVGAKKP
jgi:hypothetical protein